jgi:hypothetical protein
LISCTIERYLRTSRIDEKGDFIATVYPHIDHWERIGFYKLQTYTCAVAFHFIGRLAFEAFQLRNIQCWKRTSQPLAPADVTNN